MKMPNKRHLVLIIISVFSLSTINCIEISISEELPIGTIIGNLKSYYEKKGISTLGKSFSIFQKSDQKDVISIDKTMGTLKIGKRVDRETLCRRLSICKIDFSVYLNEFHKKIDVLVLVNDINDFTPTWKDLSHISISFKDGDVAGAHKAIPMAVDEDVGKNASLEYRLENEGYPFMLRYLRDENKLFIESSRMIDREEVSSYNLTLIAYDNGKPSLTGSTSILIDVRDINDNYPIFTKSTYSPTRTVNEDEPVNSVILTVHATDKDSGDYGRVSYTFGSSSSSQQRLAKEYFVIQANSGNVIVKKVLDYDRMPQKRFVFEVLAHDNAKDDQYRLSSTATVSIDVQDKIDEKPVIKVCFLPHGCTSSAKKTPTISENIPVETKIAEVEVTDLDQNDNIKCNIVSPGTHMTGVSYQPKFKLKLQLPSYNLERYETQNREKKMFDLLTDGYFDRETNSNECFRIHCEDSIKNFNQKTFCLDITDFNDNPPVVKKEIVVYAREEDSGFGPVWSDRPIRDYIEDKDAGVNSQLVFTLDSSDANSMGLFSVDRNTGKLSPKVKFDREKQDIYFVRIVIADKGTPSLSTSAQIKVMVVDVNDHSPVFTEGGEYTMHVEENQQSNINIGKVEAKDSDLPANGYGVVKYRLADRDASFPFQLNPDTGDIQTLIALDREKKAHYSFSVVAEDQASTKRDRKSSTARVTVIVRDVNDNPPTFRSTQNTVFQVTDKEPGHKVGEVYASDPDEGINQEIEYQLMNKNDVSDYFDIDPRSGLILINKALHGLQNRMFRLEIRACDKGHPKQCSQSKTFQAQVTDQSHIMSENNGMNQDSNSNSRSRSGSNEAIIICLSIVFVVLIIATVVLVCTIRRKSIMLKKQRQQASHANAELEAAEVKMISGCYDLPPSYKDYNHIEDDMYKAGTIGLKKQQTLDVRAVGGKRHYYATTPRMLYGDLTDRPPSNCSQPEYQCLETSGLRTINNDLNNRLYNTSHKYYEIKPTIATVHEDDDDDGLHEMPETATLKHSESGEGPRLCVDKMNKSTRHYPFSSYTEASFV